MRLIHNFILYLLTLRLRWGKQPKFKRWLKLEQKKEKIIKATDGGDFPEELLGFLSVAFSGVSYKWFEFADWIQLVKSFYVCISLLPKLELPIVSPSDEKPQDSDWDYPTRTWHLYSHMLAKTYGWDLEYISELSVFDALAHIQEILTDEQLDREFYYGLSEAAYSYDKHTQQSKFKPLPRPHWMRKRVKPIKKFLIPKDMLPMGVINPNALPDEYLPKEIKKT